MMTLDEAIAHAREMASKLRKMTSITNGKPYEECLECASEHEQLAAWLEELKRYKSQKVLIKVKPQDAKTLKRILQASQFGIAYPDTQYEVVPMVSGGQADRWIPVSERLPEYSGLYLVSFCDLVTVANFTGTGFTDRSIPNAIKEVVAWKPLPKPYKESEDE